MDRDGHDVRIVTPAEPFSRVPAAAHTAHYLQGLEFAAGADQHGGHRLAIAARINAQKDLICATSIPLMESRRLLAVGRMDDRPNHAQATGADFAGASVVLPNQLSDHEWRRDWTPPSSAAAQVFVVGESSMEAMLSAVGTGRGVCVVPEYVSRYYPQPGVSFVAVAALGPCSVEIAALRSRQLEPLIGALIGVAQGLPKRGSTEVRAAAAI